MKKYIVAVETIKIKEFLFSTNKLRVIRGASYLLDYLNQIEVPKILKKYNITENNIIYVGAGNAKFFVEDIDDDTTLKKVKDIIEEIKNKYEKEAPGAKIVGVYSPTEYEKGKKSSGDKIWDAIDKLAGLTAIEKNKGFSNLNIDLPYIEKCELSRTEVAEVSIENFWRDLEYLGFNRKDNKLFFNKSNESQDNRSDNLECYPINVHILKKQVEDLAKVSGKISDASFRKILFSNLLKEFKGIDNVGFYNTIKEYVRDDEYTVDENDEGKIDIKTNIQDYQDNNSFIGLMYSDGDGLGDFLKGVKENFIKISEINDNAEDLYLEFMGKFSKKLDECTKESLKDVLKEVFDKSEKKDRWGEFLIVGGDDVCAVFPPNLVIEISTKFQKKFEEKMKDEMIEIIKSTMKNKNQEEIKKDIEEMKITSSSGVIIAKAKTPMFQLFEKVLHLQKNAKKKRKEAIDLSKNKTGFIDFQVIGSEGCVDIEDFRNRFKDNQVMERPYSIALIEESDKFKNIDGLLTIIKNSKKEEKKFPKNKLRYIYDLKVNKTKENFEKKMELINILSKMNREEVKFVKEVLCLNHEIYQDFEKDFRNIFDILELYNFVFETKDRGKE